MVWENCIHLGRCASPGQILWSSLTGEIPFPIIREMPQKQNEMDFSPSRRLSFRLFHAIEGVKQLFPTRRRFWLSFFSSPAGIKVTNIFFAVWLNLAALSQGIGGAFSPSLAEIDRPGRIVHDCSLIPITPHERNHFIIS
jgi:hypothetical protein